MSQSVDASSRAQQHAAEYCEVARTLSGTPTSAESQARSRRCLVRLHVARIRLPSLYSYVAK